MKSLKLFALSVLSSFMMMVGAAHAELPASVATTITAIQTDGTSLFDLVFPVVAAFLGLSIVIKLFKRFANKV